MLPISNFVCLFLSLFYPQIAFSMNSGKFLNSSSIEEFFNSTSTTSSPSYTTIFSPFHTTANILDPKSGSGEFGHLGNFTETTEQLSLPRAEFLRSKREPPFTIIKHRTRIIRGPGSKSRRRSRRIRKLKPVYGPPNYAVGKPISYYKPSIDFYEITTIKPSVKTQHQYFENNYKTVSKFKNAPKGFEFDQHLYSPIESEEVLGSFGGTENMYGNEEIGFNLYDDTSFTADTEKDKLSNYNFYEITEPTKYGKGKKKIKFASPGGGGTGQSSYGGHSSIDIDKIPLTYNEYPARGSYDTKYGINYESPSVGKGFAEPPSISSHHQSSNFYSSGHGGRVENSFGEPPVEEHISISYEPSYEINIPSENSNYLPKNIYGTPANTGSEHSNENYQTNFDHDYSNGNIESNEDEGIRTGKDYGHLPSYVQEPIGDNSRLPLEKDRPAPNYDFPKSSYEVPIYESFPFDSDNTHQSDYYPPLTTSTESLEEHQHHQPQQIGHSESAKVEITLPQKDSNFSKLIYINNNKFRNNRLLPGFTRVKGRKNQGNDATSITDVDVLHDKPILIEKQKTQQDSDGIISTTLKAHKGIQKQRRRRVRKKKTGSQNPTDSIDLHTLDSEDLQKAYSSSSLPTVENYQIHQLKNEDLFPSTQSANSDYDQIQIPTENKYFNEFNKNYKSNIPSSMETVSFSRWEPTKIKSVEKTTRSSSTPKIEVISIDKSKSHSFYGGTVSPEEFKNYHRREMTKHPGINSRKDNSDEDLESNSEEEISSEEVDRSSDESVSIEDNSEYSEKGQSIGILNNNRGFKHDTGKVIHLKTTSRQSSTSSTFPQNHRYF